MAPVQSAYADTGSATAASLTVTLGAGATAGHTLILIANSDATLTGPGGYTLDVSNVGAQGFYVWSKIAAGGETSAAVTLSVSDCAAATLLEFTGSLMIDSWSLRTAGSVTTSATGSTGGLAASSELAIVALGTHNFSTASTGYSWTTATNRQSGATSYATTVSQNVGLAVGDFTTSTASIQSDTASWTTAPGDVAALIAVYRTSATVTAWSGFGTATPTGISFASDSGGVSLATCFQVTQSSLSLTKIRFYWPSGTNAGTALDCGLFDSTSGAASGSVLTGTAGTITALANSWNEYTLTAPYALTANNPYYVTVYTIGTNGGYGYVPFQFAQDCFVGPIQFLHDGALTNVRNGGFVYGSSISPVTGSFHQTLYGVDVEVALTSTQYTQAVTTSSSTTATITKAAGLPKALSSGTTASRLSAVGKVITVTPGTVATLSPLRTLLNAITFTLTTAATLVKRPSPVISATAVTGPIIAKAVTTTKPVSSPSVATVLKRANMTKTATVGYSLTGSHALGVVRLITSPLIVPLTNRVAKSFSSSSAVTLALTTAQLKLKAITAGVVTGATTTRSTLLNRVITVPEVVGVTKGMTKSTSIAVPAAGSIIKSILLTRAQALSSSASLSIHAAQTVFVNVSSSSIATVTKQVRRTISFSSAMVFAFLSIIRRNTARRGWGIFQ